MALVKEGDIKRIAVHDGWVDVHAGMSFDRVLAMVDGSDLNSLANPSPAVLRGILTQAVVAWSYEDPVTPANIGLLDIKATMEVYEQLTEVFWGNLQGGGVKSATSPPVDGRKV